MVAPEGLRELCRLAVANPAGHLSDRQRALAQQLVRAAHPDLGQERAEARAPRLGEGALELAARGGEATGDGVELQVVGVLAVDDLDRFLE